MATALTPLGLPALEMPSPTASETSSTHSNTSAHHANHNNQHQTLSTQTNQGVANPNAPARPRRAHHAPSRPNLRVAFKSFTSTATVLVGEEGSKAKPLSQYLVHKELLAGASPFFAAALNGTFAEGLEQVVRLPEEKPETWEWFLQWLYTGTLTTQPTASEIVSASQHRARGAGPGHAAGQRQGQAPCYDLHLDGDLRNQQGSPKYFLLLDLYALSDRMLTTPLSNHVLSTIARLSEQTNSVPTPSDTWILYDGIRESAPLRKLVLDLFAYKKTDKLLETHKDEWHPRFLRELVVKLKRPGPEMLERHSLVAWRPRSWSNSKACEGCKEILRPNISGDRCCACEKAFCSECLRRHAGEGWTLPNDVSGCKPWVGRGMCLRYHEHGEGEACG
ncbi:hypothetical protein CLAFUW4_12950 [Fulvia fulva]|uniref:BTB domain-containing protein n=1 Tax=Passalora fulva TaxID=5499 RepID=A0A9Q8UVE4_PASFU|nr:uncharacterized protein CLAFUR5_12815 [Fulvia fulva]KAK4612087.1 hypothetical protein CLAFUR4_12954 [Fulvia fulva]UJO23787.1 hypothetical protein CLAFUR5_12815 [Fulvia fulva]WPV21481.1 hypothetical protein CLAFUW4_12950 [Fulvia fulva]WPV36314.1 hypothetical protein CLAFUW7_12957 [Fulvia fulva]